MAGVAHHTGHTEASYHFTDRWCLHLYRYTGELEVDGVSHTIEPQACSLVPPGVRMVYRYGDDPCSHAYVHFATGEEGEPWIQMPIMQPLGPAFERFWQRLESVIGFSIQQPRRAEARLYDLLFSLAEVFAPAAARYSHPLMQPVLAWIDLHLGERVQVADLCREFEISHNYLNRLFKQDLETTAGAYLQRRRAERAINLLTETTLPVKVVAAELGYTDLAQFNKFIRRHTGHAPSELSRQ